MSSAESKDKQGEVSGNGKLLMTKLDTSQFLSFLKQLEQCCGTWNPHAAVLLKRLAPFKGMRFKNRIGSTFTFNEAMDRMTEHAPGLIMTTKLDCLCKDVGDGEDGDDGDVAHMNITVKKEILAKKESEVIKKLDEESTLDPKAKEEKSIEQKVAEVTSKEKVNVTLTLNHDQVSILVQSGWKDIQSYHDQLSRHLFRKIWNVLGANVRNAINTHKVQNCNVHELMDALQKETMKSSKVSGQMGLFDDWMDCKLSQFPNMDAHMTQCNNLVTALEKCFEADPEEPSKTIPRLLKTGMHQRALTKDFDWVKRMARENNTKCVVECQDKARDYAHEENITWSQQKKSKEKSLKGLSAQEKAQKKAAKRKAAAAKKKALQAQQQSKKGRNCANCGMNGHFSADCKKKCKLCGKPNCHFYKHKFEERQKFQARSLHVTMKNMAANGELDDKTAMFGRVVREKGPSTSRCMSLSLPCEPRKSEKCDTQTRFSTLATSRKNHQKNSHISDPKTLFNDRCDEKNKESLSSLKSLLFTERINETPSPKSPNSGEIAKISKFGLSQALSGKTVPIEGKPLPRLPHPTPPTHSKNQPIGTKNAKI